MDHRLSITSETSDQYPPQPTHQRQQHHSHQHQHHTYSHAGQPSGSHFHTHSQGQTKQHPPSTDYMGDVDDDGPLATFVTAPIDDRDDIRYKRRYKYLKPIVYELEDENNVIAYKIAVLTRKVAEMEEELRFKQEEKLRARRDSAAQQHQIEDHSPQEKRERIHQSHSQSANSQSRRSFSNSEDIIMDNANDRSLNGGIRVVDDGVIEDEEPDEVAAGDNEIEDDY